MQVVTDLSNNVHGLLHLSPVSIYKIFLFLRKCNANFTTDGFT